jgi:hypothetical protein
MKILSNILVPVILAITGTNASAQSTPTNFFIGGEIGYMSSVYNHSPAIPVHIDHLSSAQVHLNGVFQMPNKIIVKTGISTYYLRSGLVNGEYLYNSFYAVPLVASFKRIELSDSRSVLMMAGPQISFLNKYGVGSPTDEYFDIYSGNLSTFKVGLSTDVCLFSRHGDWVRTFGIKTTIDFPGATLNPNQHAIMLDNYVSNVFYFGLIRKWK